MSSLRLAYRALEATHTQTRRLAYITAMLSMLGRSNLPERLLLAKMTRWSQEHQEDLAGYWVQTGEMTSTRRNSAGARYLDLAINLGVIASISGEYRLTRIGLTLFALVENLDSANPFILTLVERLFYTHLLLDKDADVLLTLLGRLWEQPGISLAGLQNSYQQDFVKRLASKGRVVEDERLKQQLLERRLEIETGWKNPAKYAEHIVPPRLNWLLDLGLLETASFQRHQHCLTDAGATFVGRLLCLGEGAFLDVSELWLSADFWRFAPRDLLNVQPTQLWDHLSEVERQAVCAPLLKEAFAVFQHSMVPKASLTQVLLYMSIKLILKNQVIVSPYDLTQWLSIPRVLNGQRYEVRLSPQENVSYIVLIPA